MRLLLLVSLLTIGASSASAQFPAPGRFLQLGATVGPGVGVQAGLALPALTVFTQEAVAHVHYRFGPPEEQYLVAGFGVGAGIRLARIVYIVLDHVPGPFELDAGLRFGPSFAFSFVEESAATRIRQFRLFGDLFARGTIEIGERYLIYGEVGTGRGLFRAGIVLAL